MRILVVEDDKKQCYLLQFQLGQEGYDVDVCSDGADAEYYISQKCYDIILLDRLLPHKDGITILKEMRSNNITCPVIMLTALGELGDKISGLDSGADDYLVKPFEFEELLARIRCLLRRPSNIENTNQIKTGDITYSIDENVLSGPEDLCTLSQKEGKLAEIFLHNPDQTLPRSMILTHVWGTDYEIEDGNLDNYIYFIRRRLKNVGSKMCIQTVRGVGYRLNTEEKRQ
jgi:DNA-binding response OmpR family regulator